MDTNFIDFAGKIFPQLLEKQKSDGEVVLSLAI